MQSFESAVFLQGFLQLDGGHVVDPVVGEVEVQDRAVHQEGISQGVTAHRREAIHRHGQGTQGLVTLQGIGMTIRIYGLLMVQQYTSATSRMDMIFKNWDYIITPPPPPPPPPRIIIIAVTTFITVIITLLLTYKTIYNNPPSPLYVPLFPWREPRLLLLVYGSSWGRESEGTGCGLPKEQGPVSI